MNHYNWNIIGHERVVSELERELVSGNLVHAYLFAGTDNVGKYTVAKTLAKILQCENNYCNNCTNCSEIEKGYHSDTIEIADNGESIKIEEVREVLAKLNMSRRGKYKILLIKNIERMTVESANAMLKTLEDPPPGVIFLLTSGRVKEIPTTVISRLRVYNFQRLAEAKVVEIIQKNYPLADAELGEEIASFAAGRPGRALSFMEKPELLDEARKLYDDVRMMVGKSDHAAFFGYIGDIVKASKEDAQAESVKDFIDAFMYTMRIQLTENAADPKRAQQLIKLLKDVQRTYELMKRNINNRLLLENLTLQL